MNNPIVNIDIVDNICNILNTELLDMYNIINFKICQLVFVNKNWRISALKHILLIQKLQNFYSNPNDVIHINEYVDYIKLNYPLFYLKYVCADCKIVYTKIKNNDNIDNLTGTFADWNGHVYDGSCQSKIKKTCTNGCKIKCYNCKLELISKHYDGWHFELKCPCGAYNQLNNFIWYGPSLPKMCDRHCEWDCLPQYLIDTLSFS
tara:strand:- start:1455 stop:2069 length:615 start_codon:yes stop_codon:yes gene_type:complete